MQRLDFDPLHQAGVIELTLPDAAGLGWWDKLDPLEAGVGELPPLIDNQPLADKIVTWLRVRAGASAALRLAWAGINAAQVRQRVEVRSERLADGDGTPDQERRLGRAPVLPGSVTLTGASVTIRRTWRAIDDIMAAGPEVPVVLPGTMPEALGATDVFTLDAEAGIVRFGDGLTGRRPPQGEALYADYAYCEGREGNVGPGAILASPAVPDGITVTNPVATWGGADGEDARSGEKQVQRLLQTRDRLVTAEDFRTIAWRSRPTPVWTPRDGWRRTVARSIAKNNAVRTISWGACPAGTRRDFPRRSPRARRRSHSPACWRRGRLNYRRAALRVRQIRAA